MTDILGGIIFSLFTTFGAYDVILRVSMNYFYGNTFLVQEHEWGVTFRVK